jgi:hypothetical protein
MATQSKFSRPNFILTVKLTLNLILLAALFLLALPRVSAAAGYSAEMISTAAPTEVSAAIREILSDKGVRVNGPSGPLCEIWLRKAVPAQDASQQLGVVYGQIAEGTLVGVVRFLADVKDYRQQPVKAGVYTLRYALLPQNGNHLGVSPNRDFLLASPASADQKPANLPVEEVLAGSRKSAGTGHPSVWSLAASTEEAPAPKMLHQEDPDLWMVGFGLNLQSAPNNLTARPVWLVVVGHAPEA